MGEHKNGVVKARPSDGKPAVTGGAYTINLENFSKRLKSFYSNWNQNKVDLWGNADAVVVATPPASEDLRYLKSSALNIWLLGYEFPDTIMVFTKKQFHLLCSQKKASLIEVVKKPAKESAGVDVVMHVKARSDDGTSQMSSMFRAIIALSKEDIPIVGHIAREAPEGKFLELWDEKLKGSNFRLCDVTNGFCDLFSVKDSVELTNVKKAAYLSSSVMRHFVVPKLEKVIDEENKVSHSSLMDDTEKIILDPRKIKVKLRADNIDICYPPIFQSGGAFDLKPSASSNDDNLYYDPTSVIICAIGSRYGSYCSNVARTFLIDPNAAQSKAYEVLLKAHEAAISALVPGKKISVAYQTAISIIEKDAPELLASLTKSAGTGIGIEFRESGLALNAKNDRVLKPGMIFNVSLGFQNLQSNSKNPKTDKYSLLLADTVVISEKDPDVVTSLSSKAVKDVAYSFNEDGEDNEEERPKVRSQVRNGAALSSKAILRSDKQEMSKEEQRRQHQAELAHQKNLETARRLAGEGAGPSDNRGAQKAAGDLVAYRSVNDVPTPRDLMIQVDQKNESVLIPVYGTMIPFHVATIKSVSSQQDGSRICYIRIIFNIPGTPFNPHDASTLKHQGSIYLKEVSFRSKDPRHISEIVQLIKTLRRQVASRESARAERATLVSQERLQISGAKFKPIRLQDLWIRPPFGGRGRKLTGSLEGHTNGFRYATSRPDERVDILYNNVKHAFFQPAQKEMITLLHFHLHNHIMVGNKKTKDVQFYVEVMDVVQTVGGGKRSAYDPDEIEEEQRERARKNKINTEFESFVNRVSDLWGQPQFKRHELEFDQPLRDLGFHGVPHKSSVFISPTSSCLVELTETPFVVITLAEIEIVNLERVGLGQKNFDMTVVFKDFKRDVLRIDSIPSTALDGIKEWLDTTGLKYYESRLNLNWRPILKTITDDPEKFIEDGGWEFLNMEVSDSDSDRSEESDKGYVPSDVQSDSGSEEEDDESESLVESEDDEEEVSEEGSEEDEGKTWEELEREASNADKQKEAESDSEEERNRRKMKAFGKARVPDKRHLGGSSSMIKRPKLR